MPNQQIPNSAMSEIGEVDERGFVIEWTVRDFFSLPASVDEWYFSPSFSFEGAQWYLKMYPNGRKKHKSEGFIGVFLCLESSGSSIQVNLSIGLKTSKNKIAEEKHGTHHFEELFNNYGWIKVLKRSELRERKFELAPSGHLTWICRLKHPQTTDAASKFFSLIDATQCYIFFLPKKKKKEKLNSCFFFS